MESTYKAEEELIQKAVHTYNEEKCVEKRVNIAKLAREQGVSYPRLRRRIAGRACKTTREHPNRRLDPAQYSALYEQIDRFDDTGAPLSAQDVRKAADAILERDHTDPTTAPPKVSRNWPYRFLQQTDRYIKRPRRVTDVDRIYDGDHINENSDEISASHTGRITTTTTTTSYKTPSPPPESTIKTPTTLRSIRQEITRIRSSGKELSPGFDRLLRGILSNAEKGAMASAALDELLQAKKRPSHSKSRSKRQIKLIRVGDVRRHINPKDKADIEARWRSKG
ncbi:hypothetical protein ANOM_010733 [Aspergillus nomiae NRRL 13137]|uniref:HTH CENPB-type domain-containing protein n=1 Tax=Aspergillus nomiae NRRL (strain ATCC 15546 / NRRL 13137 / CBS 260.88 / M93) TaxID=1509407 RepID=A0A0L1IR42_ASPN3|nr:uncharacterized protein ANOM_010733 [Aspergillus nomiae NRRL 13137]KNG82051.1 hypothetical protein ANOM_010733 [Aspergillus nomiae NRRL 13137]